MAGLFLAAAALVASAGTLTLQTNRLGPTPELLGYNCGHFYPGSNTREWWRYAGVTGARMFISASEIEPADDLGPWGDGVTNEATFFSRRGALRVEPFNTNFINWTAFSNRFENTDLGAGSGVNHIKVNPAMRDLRRLGVRVCAQITVGESTFPITGTNDWAGRWELWQHFYAQAFHLAREFSVERYQMFNEPDHPNAGGLTVASWFLRLQLAADAVHAAIADVNTRYGKKLIPTMLAPVTAGGASAYDAWGAPGITNRHRTLAGQWDTNFWLVRRYDYHQYNAQPTSFGSTAATLQGRISADMGAEAPMPLSISEWNVHTGATFDGLVETLDSPSKYPRFGAIAVNLARNGVSELYCFKFTQTVRDGGNYPVAKNGMHYGDNATAPYNVGGVTKAGEVWRLFNKAFAPGRDLTAFTRGAGLEDLEILAARDTAQRRYFVFSVNNSSSAVPVRIEAAAWALPSGQRFTIEEVSEACFGGVRELGRVSAASVLVDAAGAELVQPGNSVWLLTAGAAAVEPEETSSASDDAMVKDGSNRGVNYGASSVLWVKNNSTNANARNAAFIKFRLPRIHRPDVQTALLAVRASTLNSNVTAQAIVYGLDADDWTQDAIRWNNAPNLKQNQPAGAFITNGVITGVGDSARLLGQLVVSSTAPAERLIDVTEFVRNQTNSDVTILMVQDPRWNVTLPSLAPGDVQPDGVQIVSMEGATADTPGPQLRLIRLRDSDHDGISDEAERTLFHSNPDSADSDQDGTPDGEEMLPPTAGTPPALNIAAAPGLVVLRWPAWAEGLILTSTLDVRPPALWEAVGGSESVTNGRRQIAVPATTSGRFFRLDPAQP